MVTQRQRQKICTFEFYLRKSLRKYFFDLISYSYLCAIGITYLFKLGRRDSSWTNGRSQMLIFSTNFVKSLKFKNQLLFQERVPYTSKDEFSWLFKKKKKYCYLFFYFQATSHKSVYQSQICDGLYQQAFSGNSDIFRKNMYKWSH